MKTKSDMKPFIIAALSLTLLVGLVMMIFRQKNRKFLWRLLLRL